MEGLKSTNGEVDLIPLSEASEMTGYTPEYFNFLSRSGKFKARKIGRNWYTTRQWVQEFMAEKTGQNEPDCVQEPEREVVFHWGDLGGNYSGKKSSFGDEVWKSIGGRIDRIKESDWQNDEVPMRVGKKPFGISVMAVAVVFVIFIGFQAANFLNNKYAVQQIGETQAAFDGNAAGIVAGETTTKSQAAYASENFKIKEVTMGGNVALMARSYENSQIEISDIRSEVITSKSKNKEEIKMLIYWKTNKLAISNLEYSKMNGTDPKSIKEENYGYNHSVVLAGLEAGTAYTYVITVKDRWGNAISSDRYSTYTGARSVSVFDLIVGSVKDVFSWAIKK